MYMYMQLPSVYSRGRGVHCVGYKRVATNDNHGTTNYLATNMAGHVYMYCTVDQTAHVT